MLKSKRQTCEERGSILLRGRSLIRPSARQGRKAIGSAPQTAWLPKSSRSAAFCFNMTRNQKQRNAHNSILKYTFCHILFRVVFWQAYMYNNQNPPNYRKSGGSDPQAQLGRYYKEEHSLRGANSETGHLSRFLCYGWYKSSGKLPD